MVEARDERHRYGQHYTPRAVAKLLAAFAVRCAGDLVFDPSCGDGRLLIEALALKQEMSSSGGRKRAGEIYGADRSARAIKLATANGAQGWRAHFFDIDPGMALSKSTVLPAAFDAIIGNPPYIRQELMGQRDKRRIDRRLERDRALSPDIHWPQWSGRSDIYVYFFAHATRFLKRDGRLAFLTASSWLDVGYGVSLREFLLANFRIIAVIESGCESFFEGASINTTISVLEREPHGARRDANQVRFVQLSSPLEDILEAAGSASGFARRVERASESKRFVTHRIRILRQAELAATITRRQPSVNGRRSYATSAVAAAGWGKFIRADEVFFRIIERGA